MTDSQPLFSISSENQDIKPAQQPQQAQQAKPLLEAQKISKTFPSFPEPVRAVDSLSLSLKKGRSLALVGESGSGKTTAVQICLGMLAPDSGQVLWKGKDIVSGSGLSQLKKGTGLVFQNPYSSLNPRWTGADIIAEPLRLSGIKDKKILVEKSSHALEMVGLEPEVFLRRYPQDMSGGQAQRVAMARALVTNPELLVADEPLSAVDVSGRVRIVSAFQDLRARGMSLLIVLHDLGIARLLADDIMVMHQGKIVEYGPAGEVLKNPRKDYTRRLMEAAAWDIY